MPLFSQVYRTDLMQRATEDDVLSTPGGAIFDLSGAYRYLLWRVWRLQAPTVSFIMLNPNNADAERDDPTIRRCAGFARAWGFGGMEVTNLFAFRTPDPGTLSSIDDPEGPENAFFIRSSGERSGLVVVGWGNAGGLLDAGSRAWSLLAGFRRVYCLGRTRLGQPRHPLYLPARTPLEIFRNYETA